MTVMINFADLTLFGSSFKLSFNILLWEENDIAGYLEALSPLLENFILLDIWLQQQILLKRLICDGFYF